MAKVTAVSWGTPRFVPSPGSLTPDAVPRVLSTFSLTGSPVAPHVGQAHSSLGVVDFGLSTGLFFSWTPA